MYAVFDFTVVVGAPLKNHPAGRLPRFLLLEGRSLGITKNNLFVVINVVVAELLSEPAPRSQWFNYNLDKKIV